VTENDFGPWRLETMTQIYGLSVQVLHARQLLTD
jgi:hypothetical protein